MPFYRHWWQHYIWKHLAEAEAMSLASFDGASVMAIDIVPWETWSTDTRWPTWQTSFTPSLNCTLSGPRWFGSWWVAYMFEQKIVYIFVGAWYSKCKMDGDPIFCPLENLPQNMMLSWLWCCLTNRGVVKKESFNTQKTSCTAHIALQAHSIQTTNIY